MPAQVSSSSTDLGSKLRGPSQSSPRVASKRGVDITKLNLLSLLTFVQACLSNQHLKRAFAFTHPITCFHPPLEIAATYMVNLGIEIGELRVRNLPLLKIRLFAWTWWSSSLPLFRHICP
ncbi:hypothetical protein AVEN_111722-1 [Araneus ventricosus]|uniref:Uncharacterized protein n=1 Tax=Araneus ventricosus TaxID=182803 RepID=A0A4Y2C7Q8_ARAVE|nr:hypothetical protein AVEN_111722-1 [Araneus ventricosus]